jgi:beta-1,4-mannosyl-glycoprotein beta-1,4-N-acetylglucosaminyltransferase
LRLNNIIEKGGWHFCNLKTADELLYKYKNLCETKDDYVFNEKINEKFLKIEEIEKKIKDRVDLIGRKEKFIIQKLDNTFPNYVLKNIDQYKKWIAD